MAGKIKTNERISEKALKAEARRRVAAERRGDVLPPLESMRHAYEIERGDTGTIKVVRDPLDHYRKSNTLDPSDKKLNEALWRAGDWYRATAYAAGLNGLSAIDYNMLGAGGGDPAYGMPVTEYAASKRIQLRKADDQIRHEIGAKFEAVVWKVAVDGVTAAEAVSIHAGWQKAKEVVGMEMLRSGLGVLARHLGIIGAEGVDRSTASWHKDDKKR